MSKGAGSIDSILLADKKTELEYSPEKLGLEDRGEEGVIVAGLSGTVATAHGIHPGGIEEASLKSKKVKLFRW